MGVGERALCHKSGIKIDINVAPERQPRGGAAGEWLQLTLNSIPALLLSSFVHRSRVEFSSDNLPQASGVPLLPHTPPSLPACHLSTCTFCRCKMQNKQNKKRCQADCAAGEEEAGEEEWGHRRFKSVIPLRKTSSVRARQHIKLDWHNA